MSYYEMRIPTKRCVWKVKFGSSLSYEQRVLYYVSTGRCRGAYYDRVDEREVPKSIRKRARCFESNPKLFGRKRNI